MYRLSYPLVFILAVQITLAQSPHGENFNIDCANCHSPESWELLNKTMKFDHNATDFVLDGQHKSINCAACHTSLVFTTEKKECMDCHTDMHNNSVGKNCDQCHTTKSWIIADITGLHQQTQFPLLGAHRTAQCTDCHHSASELLFEPMRTECADCHYDDYMSTSSPNHQQSGYSTSCTDCHSIKSMEWIANGIEHDFFPLKKGHAIGCNECHKEGSSAQLSNECIECHQANYNETLNPNHQQLDFSGICNDCHGLDQGWKPAKFNEHDNAFFPIYSGEHNNEWNSCTECHTNPASYSSFNCINCHEHNQVEMNEEHHGINGYSYQSELCFACHPRGDESGAFDHSNTGFVLTGSHLETQCMQCHTNGFEGTSSLCISCHQSDYNQATNPSHLQQKYPTLCESCHNTTAWEPSTFNHDAQYFPIYSGKHREEWNNCTDCHTNPGNISVFSCINCHEHNASETNNDHNEVNGYSYNSMACLSCHPRGDD